MYCKLPTNGKQLPAFPLTAMTGIDQALLVGSLLTLAVTNSICNQFYFDSCSCQLYVNLSCELMVYVTSFTLTAVLVSCMLTLAVSYNVSAFLY